MKCYHCTLRKNEWRDFDRTSRVKRKVQQKNDATSLIKKGKVWCVSRLSLTTRQKRERLKKNGPLSGKLGVLVDRRCLSGVLDFLKTRKNI